MGKLLDELRADAVGLIQSDLPVDNEVRTVLGALVSHVQDLEASLTAGSGTLPPPLEVEPPTPAVDPAVTEAQAELDAAKQAAAAAQAKLDALAPATAEPEVVPAGGAPTS